MKKGEKPKKVGVVSLKLNELINDPARKTYSLDKCPDASASICISLTSTKVESRGGALSQMSDVMSIDSEPDSNFNFEDEEEKKSVRKKIGERKPVT